MREREREKEREKDSQIHWSPGEFALANAPL